MLNLKSLIVVLVIATAVFVIAKPICVRFMEESDFARRRNAWFALTTIAFVSPNFWLFVLVATPILAWAARKDANPVAFYMLVMSVISPQGLELPTVLINSLFELNIYRILSFAILIPTAWRVLRSADKSSFVGLTLMDKLILAYAGLYLILFIPYESTTHTMRRGFLLFIDVLVLYFAVSRTCVSQRAIAETMASFCLACAIFAPLAVFESAKGWLLYQGIADQWGLYTLTSYLQRSGMLRAQVSSGHALALGYMLSIAFGFWLHLQSRVESVRLGAAGMIWMWMGLLASYSRGPWVVAVAIMFAFLGLGLNGAARFFKALLVAALVASVVLMSPIGDGVIDNLPFFGTVDETNVTYRQQLAEMSWQLIQENPFFGSPDVLKYLESLRQGQGIIDLVNSYASIAMFYGLAGLFLFLSYFFVGMWNAYRLAKRSFGSDPELAKLGVSLIACMLGTLLMMGFGSFGTSLEKMYYVLAGLVAAYARIGLSKDPAEVGRAREAGFDPHRTLQRI